MLTEIEIFQKVNQVAKKKEYEGSLDENRLQIAEDVWQNYDFDPYVIDGHGEWQSDQWNTLERQIETQDGYGSFVVVFNGGSTGSADIYGVFIRHEGVYKYQFAGEWHRWRGHGEYEEITGIRT